MAKKRGGSRPGAGRRPDPVIKKRATISIPVKYEKEIIAKFREITKNYVARCRREL